MGDPVQFTQEQLNQLIAALLQPRAAAPGAAGQPDGGTALTAGAASVVGTMPPCRLGKDKLKRYKRWKDWIADADTKMSFLGITNEARKLSFIRTCAGPELTDFWIKEAQIRYTEIPADPVTGAAAQAVHTYEEVLTETKEVILRLVSRDRAVIDLLRMEQGNRSFMEYLSEVEDQEYLCRTDELRLTGDDLKRISLIAGMKDRTLAEKAVAEKYTLLQVIQAGVRRETSRANAEAMQARAPAPVHHIADRNLEERIDYLQRELEEVKMVKKHGKYSARYNQPESKQSSATCIKCCYEHKTEYCPADAEDRSCNRCGKKGHFARSSLCPAKRKKTRSTKKVEYYVTSSSDSESETECGVARRIHAVGQARQWPGVAPDAHTTTSIHYVEKPHGERQSKRVWVDMGGTRVRLFCDTGSRLTIITPEMYMTSMGTIVPAKCNLRAWGSDTHLDVKGMFQTSLTAVKGASVSTWVYVVGGTRPEPLLGDADAVDLGIIKFRPEGRTHAQDSVNNVRTQSKKPDPTSIPAKLRKAGIEVRTEKPVSEALPEDTVSAAMRIVHNFTGPVFTDRIGHVKTRPVVLQYEENFKPIQPPRYPVPYHYQEKIAEHLRKLKKEGVIEDVDPAESVDCVLNIAVSEKRIQGAIRMNIDARPLNVGAKHTKYHVTTPQEVRHELADSNVFTEIDMGNGFHQIPLAPESQVVFQSHLGLHRMKRLFFGPKNSSGIFHHEVRKALTGLPGCITIHDNVLIHGKGGQEHNNNLQTFCERAKEKGLTFKLSKSTFCSPEVKWFGRVYSPYGISADPDKIDTIVSAGRPESIAEVKSLLQAAAYNAKFAFDHKGTESYEEVTAPLREMLLKDAVFSWDKRREDSFKKLLNMLNDKSLLTPFKLGRKTHLVTDASPYGISASIYQEDEAGRWLPVDHLSRALSQQEQKWQSQIEWESLAKMWGMTMFRPYLIGTKFTSWGDHQPLVPFYNNLAKLATARINKHRTRITDLTFTDKYLPGRQMPADFNSRHPQSIDGLTPEHLASLGVDDGTDIHVMRIVMADLPAALTLDRIKHAAAQDPLYIKLKQAVQKGKKPTDPDLTPYTSVWDELSVINEIVCRGERLVIPDGVPQEGEGSLREWVIELGHSGHMGINATKRLLRLRLWFPGMDKMVEDKVASCLPCQASTESRYRDPLKPNVAPPEPWQRITCDHWGPNPLDGKHILVLIDALTRYPEVLVVKGTGAEDNIHAFSEVFSRHGYPTYLHSDNGPPFNGNESHLLQKYFESINVKHIPNHSALDPEATGLAEAFMKHIKKVFHTSGVDHTDPYLLIHEHLMQFRATPHPTTGKSPAELLFGRIYKTKLPDIRPNPAGIRPDIVEARANDETAKARQKYYKDRKSQVRINTIIPGDKVLLKRRTTKLNSVYEPEPYTVTHTWGSQVEAVRRGSVKTRDAQRWKKVSIQPKKTFNNVTVPTASQDREDPDIGASDTTPTATQINATDDSQAMPPPLAMALADDQRRVLNTLRDMPHVILADTVANRPARTRRPPTQVYVPAPWKANTRRSRSVPK